MAWTWTSVATGLTGKGALNLGAFYEAAMIELTTIPEFYGNTGTPGRTVYYGLGYIAPSFATGPGYPRIPIQYSQQIIPAPMHTISRVFYWLEAGVVAKIYYGVWT